ncbi:hypothetical protein KIL84_018794 [Mauremys mutica]|uniref:Uncharacterized protein n=1 Tax=Mauremys mutica TaxID=74926 RepID=A0A9D4BA12_9SAUR|nr:hypothetical protein KIL84_018794 [Mauremys mutica]
MPPRGQEQYPARADGEEADQKHSLTERFIELRVRCPPEAPEPAHWLPPPPPAAAQSAAKLEDPITVTFPTDQEENAEPAGVPENHYVLAPTTSYRRYPWFSPRAIVPHFSHLGMRVQRH